MRGVYQMKNIDLLKDRLIYIRLEKELNQKEFAKTIDEKETTYSKWERNDNIIPLNKLNKISNIYNYSLDYLCGLTNYNDYNFEKKELNIKHIGKKIKYISKIQNLNREDIAKYLKISTSTITSYQQGRILIPTINIIEFAILTNTSIDYLCGKTDNKEIINPNEKIFKK